MTCPPSGPAWHLRPPPSGGAWLGLCLGHRPCRPIINSNAGHPCSRTCDSPFPPWESFSCPLPSASPALPTLQVSKIQHVKTQLLSTSERNLTARMRPPSSQLPQFPGGKGGKCPLGFCDDSSATECFAVTATVGQGHVQRHWGLNSSYWGRCCLLKKNDCTCSIFVRELFVLRHEKTAVL